MVDSLNVRCGQRGRTGFPPHLSLSRLLVTRGVEPLARPRRLLSASPEASADCYRDYAKVLAFDSAGAGQQADAVRRQMLKQQEAGSRDQWEAVGGRIYTTALTMLAAR